MDKYTPLTKNNYEYILIIVLVILKIKVELTQNLN